MKKISDRQSLGIISGLIGGLVLILFDQISLKFGISKRSYTQAASGVWVASKRQTRSKGGNILGVMMSLGLSSLGGAIMAELFSRKGTDNLIGKGIFYGITYGAGTTALLSGFPQNKVKPTDATSNLSYVVSHTLYGLITSLLISKLGNNKSLKRATANDPAAYLTSPAQQYENVEYLS